MPKNRNTLHFNAAISASMKILSILVLTPKATIQKAHKSVRDLVLGQSALPGRMAACNVHSVQSDPLPSQPLQFRQGQNAPSSRQLVGRAGRSDVSRNDDRD